MLDQHSQQELRFWGSVWPLQDWKSCLKVFPNSGGARAPGSPSLQPPGCLCQHGAQHHHPGLGVGGVSAVPTRGPRDMFTQEGAWRCEKGQSSHYLCPGLCQRALPGQPGLLSAPNFYLPKGCPPTFWGAAANPSPAAAPSPAWPAGKPLAVVVGSTSRRRGVSAAAPSHFVTTREQ